MVGYQTGGGSGKPPNDWRTIQPNKRRRELRLLREMRLREGRAIDAIVEALRNDGYPYDDGSFVGELIGFTFDEYKALGKEDDQHPSTIRPCDAIKTEIDAYLKAYQRPKKREALRRRRHERAATRNLALELDSRSSAIWTVLSVSPRPVHQIMKDLEGSIAFRKPNGKPLIENSLRKAILAQLNKPDLKDRVHRTEGTEKHGKLMFLFCRRPDGSSEEKAPKPPVTNGYLALGAPARPIAST
jgi:hypothetical protein